MKVKVYNLAGKEISEVELSDDIFAVKVKPEVVYEVFVVQSGNQRQPLAHTKGKGEVRGGGRKPWAQKGTGRARHGSIRSPLWKGGGVIFGPRKINNFKGKLNKKIRHLALKMCLSDRVANGNLLVVENFDFAEPKTKLFTQFLRALPLKKREYLVVTAGQDEKVLRMAKNLSQVDIKRAQDLNVRDILNTPELVISRAAVEEIAKILNK